MEKWDLLFSSVNKFRALIRSIRGDEFMIHVLENHPHQNQVQVHRAAWIMFTTRMNTAKTSTIQVHLPSLYFGFSFETGLWMMAPITHVDTAYNPSFNTLQISSALKCPFTFHNCWLIYQRLLFWIKVQVNVSPEEPMLSFRARNPKLSCWLSVFSSA